MRTGRPTTEKKDNVVKVRISEEMNKYLEKESKKTGKSISEVIRCCIKKSL
jgi:predicted DNA-binding protein